MEPIDYEQVLADLEAKRVAFNTAMDNAITGIKTVLALSAVPLAQTVQPATTPAPPTTPTSTTVVTPDAFFGLGLADAAIKYLRLVKRQQTTREITDALEKANYHHTSQNFINTVNTALYRREKDEGDVVKISRHWALAEWYPGRRRKVASLNPKDFVEPEPGDMDLSDQGTNGEDR